METLRTWILGVTVTALFLAAARAVTPEGPVKRVGRLTAGLVLTLALLGPLAALGKIGPDLWSRDLPLPEQGGKGPDLAGPIIERELAAYIEEKAGELGADCTAAVTCVPDENGVPLPARAVVRGRLDDSVRRSLSEGIARDLGIPPEAQRFEEG